MKSFFSFFALTTMIIVKAQTFQYTYGGTGWEFGLAVQQTADGGYMLFGQTDSYGNGAQDMYLVKTDNMGIEQWSQTYGTVDWDFGISAQQTTDGGYILCGSFSGFGDDSLALVKTDASGNEVWNKTYSGSVSRDVGQFVQQTNDGGYIAVGFTGPGFSENIYIVKTDGNGIVQWSKVYVSSGRDLLVGVRQTNDGGYIMIGETNSRGYGGKDVYLVKTNPIGDTLWTKTYGTSSDEIGRSVYVTSDNGFILLGYQDFGGGNLYLIKTDSLGNEDWHQYYGGTGWDMGHSVQQTVDGGYILGGRKENTISSNNDMYCIKTNASGGVEWEYVYPMGIMTDANSVQQTSDGGYVLFGTYTDTIGGASSDMYLVKINAQGLASVYEDDFSPMNILAYPNPFTEYVIIEINDKHNRNFNLAVFNNLGQKISAANNITSGKTKIERGNMEPGIYFYQLTCDDKLVAGGKLIVR